MTIPKPILRIPLIHTIGRWGQRAYGCPKTLWSWAPTYKATGEHSFRVCEQEFLREFTDYVHLSIPPKKLVIRVYTKHVKGSIQLECHPTQRFLDGNLCSTATLIKRGSFAESGLAREDLGVFTFFHCSVSFVEKMMRKFGLEHNSYIWITVKRR